MKNGRGPLNRNGPKENKANIIDEKLNLNKLQSLDIGYFKHKVEKFYKLTKSQLALQCPNIKMYLHTKAYIELDYQRPLFLLWIPKMLTLLGLMKVVFDLH